MDERAAPLRLNLTTTHEPVMHPQGNLKAFASAPLDAPPAVDERAALALQLARDLEHSAARAALSARCSAAAASPPAAQCAELGRLRALLLVSCCCQGGSSCLVIGAYPLPCDHNCLQDAPLTAPSNTPHPPQEFQGLPAPFRGIAAIH